jgi:CelD/BcsL family acetyltransferase involved in cellulose biosynthesis
LIAESRLTFKFYKGCDGYAQLKPSWEQLAVQFGRHFLHFPSWYEAELARRESSEGVIFAAVFTDEALVAVLPFERIFIVRKGWRIPVMQLFYANEMGVNDVLTTLPINNYLARLTKQLRLNMPFFCLIQWQCVFSSEVTAIARNQFRLSHESKYLDFSRGAESFWQGYHKKFRHDLSRKMRNAESLGTLRLEIACDKESLPQAFETFLAVENSGWKGAGGTSIVKQPDKLDYYRTLMADFMRLNSCQINLLWLDEVPIASQFGIRINETLYLLKIGFSEDFSKLSPGYLILAKIIDEQSHHLGIKHISFVTGVSWIDRWKPSGTGVGVFYSSNGSWWSKVFVRLLHSKVMRKKLAAGD